MTRVRRRIVCRACRRAMPHSARGLCARCYKWHATDHPHTRRPWTTGDVRRLRVLYPSLPPARVADALGRTLDAVRQAAERVGCQKRTFRRLGPAGDAKVAALHARGWSDAMIAEQLGLYAAHSIRRIRLRLGLTTLGLTEAKRERVRAGYRRRLHRDGIETMGDLVRMAARLKAVRLGWPDATGTVEARLLAALEGGPKTARELAPAIGWRPTASSRTNILRMLRGLRERGLVVVAGRRATPTGNAWLVFRLADGVARHGPSRRESHRLNVGA